MTLKNTSSKVFLLSIYLFVAICAAKAAAFLTYTGTVNDAPATFSLCWINGGSVVGTLVRNNQTFTLAGDNSTFDQMFMSVGYKGRTVAYLKARRQGPDWKGSMRVEKNGDIFLVEFALDATSKKDTIPTHTFINQTNQTITFAIAYLDATAHWWATKGLWVIKPGERTTVGIPTSDSKFYYYAEASSGVFWKGDTDFWITKTGRFIIREADSLHPSFMDEDASLNYDNSIKLVKKTFKIMHFSEPPNTALAFGPSTPQ
jgi:uncharacterized membrane protein